MSDGANDPQASAPTRTMVSVRKESSVSRGNCTYCGSPLIADPSRKGVNVCPKCHKIQKAESLVLTPGSVVGDYRVLKKLAQGGMGVLYLCCPLNDLSVRYVLKTVQFGLGEDQDVYIKRFQRETELMMRLNHENIVRVHDSWSDENSAYIIMQYIDGDTLESLRKQNLYLFDEETVIQIMLQLADALNYAWVELKLLHRDIKPSNVMIDKEGYLYLLDFGIAKSLDSPETTVLTVAGHGLGTPGFMSPEQFRNVTQLDCTTDIYSLGATMYYLVAGEAPFTGKTPNVIFNEMLKRDPVPLHERCPEISENFSQLIQQTLSRDPKKRPFSWKKLIVSLERVANGQPPLPA
ncbi:MAG: serine/threonine protein kinase [Lentisphaeria bacterium]|nr:serine/threonine protein kinase [Lentisphaeria bacterium]